MRKENAEEFIGVIRPIFARHGFEDCITFTAVNERSFDCTLPILYDKSDPAETKRAAECHDELFRACMDKGYIPYRLGIQSMAGLVGGDDVFWDVVQKLKQALDPRGILSPGRYSRI
jgi:4-cresol dehydrogenase (hydroxylating)